MDAESGTPVEGAIVWATRRLDGFSGRGGFHVQGWDHTNSEGKFWIHAKPNFPISVMLDHYDWFPTLSTFHPDFSRQGHKKSRELRLVATDWWRDLSKEGIVSYLCWPTRGGELCEELCRAALGETEPICNETGRL